MIVHPIGMMRANAAAGLNLVDNFEAYTVGQTIQVANPSWYSSAGGASPATIELNGGDKILRLSTGVRFLNIVPTVAADREVSFTLKTAGSAGSVYFYLSYIDTSNYIRMGITAGSTSFGVRQTIAGSNYLLDAVNTGAAPANGDTFSATMVGSVLKLYKNGVQAGSNYTVNPASLGNARLDLDAGTSPVTVLELGEIIVRDL